MRKANFLLLSAIIMLTSCSSDNGEEPSVFSGSPAENETEVTLTFSPYQMETMARASVPVAFPTGTTRAATSIASIVTHLDVWIYENGAEVTHKRLLAAVTCCSKYLVSRNVSQGVDGCE